MICGSRRSKSRLAKAAGEEASGRMRDEKLYAVVARSTLRSLKAKNTSRSEHFWKLRCWKSVHRCGANPNQNVKNTTCSDHFWTFRCRFAWLAQGIQHLVKKRAKRAWFVAVSKALAGVGHFKRICKDAFSVAGAVQETCSSEMLRGPGAHFLRGVAFWSIRSSRFAAMKCGVTGYSTLCDLASNFSWQAQHFRQMDGKNRKTHWHWYEAISSAPNCPFWRKSRRIVSFLMLSTSKIEEVSQNCLVFDVVKFKKWESLAELLRFQTCRKADRWIDR